MGHVCFPHVVNTISPLADVPSLKIEEDCLNTLQKHTHTKVYISFSMSSNSNRRQPNHFMHKHNNYHCLIFFFPPLSDVFR